MLRLVHPAPPTQPPPPKGRRARSLKLTADEERHARAAMRNIKGTFGSWAALAQAIGVAIPTLHHALKPGRGSALLFLRVAQAGKIAFENMLSGGVGVAGRCSSCGSAVRSAVEPQHDEGCPYP